jgi:multidrug transporter EmrE-like cation transporter
LFSEPRALLFAAIGGLCAVGVDYLTLRAYASGLRVSVGAPIIIGGGIALATITGAILGERIDAARLAGVSLVIAGAVVLGVTGR